jgi:hypothetical protein
MNRRRRIASLALFLLGGSAVLAWRANDAKITRVR